jgi:thiol-disulfide isomerase/thioredoxin
MCPAGAASSDFSAGVSAYQQHQYKIALNKFSCAAAQSPRDPVTHYYLGLCYQGMNQMSLARQEFAYVANFGSGPLRTQAAAALQNLGHYQTTFSSASAALPGRAAPPAAPANRIQGRLKVLDFCASWCGPCHRFSPTFDAVAGRMSNRAEFTRVDIDEEDNKALVNKYGITAVPTLVFTDSSGRLIKKTGAYSSEEEFARDVERIAAGR